MSKKDYIPPADWIHIKFNSYEYSMMKHRRKEHKLFKREFVNAFLAEQEKKTEKKKKEENINGEHLSKEAD